MLQPPSRSSEGYRSATSLGPVDPPGGPKKQNVFVEGRCARMRCVLTVAPCARRSGVVPGAARAPLELGWKDTPEGIGKVFKAERTQTGTKQSGAQHSARGQVRPNSGQQRRAMLRCPQGSAAPLCRGRGAGRGIERGARARARHAAWRRPPAVMASHGIARPGAPPPRSVRGSADGRGVGRCVCVCVYALGRARVWVGHPKIGERVERDMASFEAPP